jgi:hypothetical protein
MRVIVHRSLPGFCSRERFVIDCGGGLSYAGDLGLAEVTRSISNFRRHRSNDWQAKFMP